MNVFQVKSRTRKNFEILCNFNFLMNILIPLRSKIDTEYITTRDIKLSDQSKKILDKLENSPFSEDLLKELCSKIKVSMTKKGSWKFFNDNKTLNMYSEFGFITVENDCVLYSKNTLSDNTLLALRKYQKNLFDQGNVDINQIKDIVITVTTD